MKFPLLFSALLGLGTLVFTTSCTKTEEVLIDTSLPQGTFTAAKTGAFVAQNMSSTTGSAKLGTDSKGTQFLQFTSDFTTVLATGTVTVYLSTSETFKADPGAGNPELRLIGTIAKNGEANFKLSPVAAAKFTHVILWCGSANVPFGYAKF